MPGAGGRDRFPITREGRMGLELPEPKKGNWRATWLSWPATAAVPVGRPAAEVAAALGRT